ncbi:MAG: amidohydrolase [Dysgonamonadaceae bacterium]|jgi:predicted amidohydrolase|nr:amidohydrolase [Dysgonamonadaceae bacterium]
MKILLFQIDLAWNAPGTNRTHIAKLIDASPESDLIVLPEMFTTGFCTSPKGIAEKAGADTLAWMQQIARDKGAALAGSVATEENGDYFNRFYFVKPDGSYTSYDKRHLFSFAGEDKEYTKGAKRIIVEYKGLRILLQICYDLRFPVFARNRSDYELIIYVANWPVPRIEAWNALLRARAIENLCYVAAVNRVGSDPYCRYNGATVLLNPFGKEICAAKSDREEVICGEIDLRTLSEFREKFPALNDADEFQIHLQ